NLRPCALPPCRQTTTSALGSPHSCRCSSINARYCTSMLALLYDIHGNLPALDAVLQDAEAAGAAEYLLGGDYGAWGPHPLECLERLRALPRATWIRGNGERWTREPPLDRPEVVEALQGRESGSGTEAGWLYSLARQGELEGVPCAQ